MSKVRVTFLGTGTSQGVPVIACQCEVCTSLDFRDKRLRSSILVEVDEKQFVIDTGPDFRQQMLNSRVQKLDAVLFTHEHKDHTAGLDDIRAFNHIQGKDMPVYGTKSVIEQLKREFSYVFSEKKYPGIPSLEVIELDGSPFYIENTFITPIQVMHYKMPVLGFRIGDFTYITDANHIDSAERDKIRGSKVMVINALQRTEHISHFTLDQALAVIDDIKPEKAYLTHISHKLGKHHDVQKELPESVSIAYDGLSIDI